MATALVPRFGDKVALISPPAGYRGPTEGLVVDVSLRGFTVETKDGMYVGGHEWMSPRDFFVMTRGS